MSKNISKLSGRKGLQQNLFERIKQVDADRQELAGTYNLGKSTLYGSQTFYEFLDEEHRSKKAFVCQGSSCLCSGDQQSVVADLESALGEGQIGTMTCLGHCYAADSFHLDGRNYSGGQSRHLDDINGSADGEINQNIAVNCLSETAFLTDPDFADYDDFAKALKNLVAHSREEVLETVKISGLRGRGGAGFPAGLKWESCMQINADDKYVICNADEGDPGAFSDRYLMEVQPLRVLFGMLVCGWITGAREGVVYIRAEYPESVRIVKDAISKLRQQNLLGNNILEGLVSFDIEVVEGAGAYICGEETALIASIEGRRAEVDVRPPFPTVSGLFKQPTIVNNVETFAAIQRILELGGEVFAGIGNGPSTGTKLISMDAGFNNPGIVEADMGTPLKQLVEEVASGFKRPTKAVHIGGPLGGLVPVSRINDLSLDFESFNREGFLLGHASFVCIPDSFPMIRYLEHLFEFTSDESCGKCFPCRLGSTRGKEMLSTAIKGERLIDRALLNDLLETMQEGSLCALGGGLPLPVKNALTYFEDELKEYFETDKNISVRDLS